MDVGIWGGQQLGYHVDGDFELSALIFATSPNRANPFQLAGESDFNGLCVLIRGLCAK